LLHNFENVGKKKLFGFGIVCSNEHIQIVFFPASEMGDARKDRKSFESKKMLNV
jgi:hypothetical protein